MALVLDETQLYVTDGNLNCVSVISSGGEQQFGQVWLIPTGWYPTSISLVNSGGSVIRLRQQCQVADRRKSRVVLRRLRPAKNSPNCNPSNQYNPQLTRAGLRELPSPYGPPVIADRAGSRRTTASPSRRATATPL